MAARRTLAAPHMQPSVLYSSWSTVPAHGCPHAPIAGHPDSVAAMLAYDQDSIITGSGDGMIRILSVQVGSLLCSSCTSDIDKQQLHQQWCRELQHPAITHLADLIALGAHSPTSC